MANVNIEICEVLCFLNNNFNKTTQNNLKPVLLDFYEDDEIIVAKETLHRCLSDVITDDVPRLVKRKGDNKRKLNVDDLIELFLITDERLLGDKLPKFVAADLSRVPTLKLENISLIGLLRRLEQYETRLNVVEGRQVICETADTAVKYPLSSSLASSADGTLIRRVPSVGEQQKDSVSVSHDAVNIDSVTPTSIDSSPSLDNQMNCSTDNNPWFLVGPNGVKRVISNLQMSDAGTNMTMKPKPKKLLKVVADGSGGAVAGIKAGVNIVRKHVIHVDNLGTECTEDSVKEFLTSNKIDYISCFKASSWMRESDRSNVLSYRICVPLSMKDIIMSKSLWPAGVILRPWKFKSTKNGGQQSENPDV